MIAVITCDGAMLGLYTSQVDAWKVAKHIIGASMWRCAPNSDVCEVIVLGMKTRSVKSLDYLVCPINHPPSMP